MTQAKTALLAGLLDAFGRRHWSDGFSSARAACTIAEDGTLGCEVGAERVQGHASAPLWFATGAWGAIYAHECAGRYGHRVDGRLNRVWPPSSDTSLVQHGLGDAVRAWAAAWPGRLFSSALYGEVGTPGHPRHPQSLDDAPRSTSLTGILKRAIRGADSPEPLERLKVAEFIEDAVRAHWHSTATDRMLKVVGPPLMQLAADPEPAVRELALLALESCAAHAGHRRTYGAYEALCHPLIEAGLNAHLQFARLAESAYAHGELEAGDRLWATATQGLDLSAPVKIGPWFDAFGDWHDLHTRLLRQAGGAHMVYARGGDPDEARQAKLEKKGLVPPPPKQVERHRALAQQLLARAAEGAERRLAIDLPAAQARRKVPLGRGQIDPCARRLFLHDIFFLQSILAQERGELQAQLRALFKSRYILWTLQGQSHPDWRWGDEEQVVALAIDHDDATLEQLGLPAYLRQPLAQARSARQLAHSSAGQEALFWQRFLGAIRDSLLRDTDLDGQPLPGEDLVPGFVVTRAGGELQLAHPVLAQPVRGSLSAPVLAGLRAWHAALRAAHGAGAWLNCKRFVSLGAEDLPVLVTIAAETLAAGAPAQAQALYRIATGGDPLVRPWPGRNPVPPLPLEAVPAALREAVARCSPLRAHQGHARVKPRGRRVEQLAKDLAPGDALSARDAGMYLGEACGGAGDSEIMRVLKSGPPLLLALWHDTDPAVQEPAILAIFQLLHMQSMYAPGVPVDALMAAAEASGIADVAHLRPGH